MGGVRVADPATGADFVPPLAHPNFVSTVRFSPDGARLLSAGYDGTARTWDARSGEPAVAPIRAGGALNGAEWSPDGARIATYARDGVVRLWDARTGQPLTEPLRHWPEVRAVFFTGDGRRLIVMHSDRITFWEVPPSPTAAPAWLPALAEAVAGRRIDEQGELAAAPDADFWFVRERLAGRNAPTDHYERWAAWCFADRGTRTTSPWAETPVADIVHTIATYGGDADKDLALRYRRPENPALMSSYAASLVSRPSASPAEPSLGEYLRALASVQMLSDELANLRTAKNPAYARDAGWRGFPARDPAATAQQTDLTAYFTAPLDIPLSTDLQSLPGLPKGLVTFDGVRFDVRGVVALSKRASKK
jgi:hypothetical protein